MKERESDQDARPPSETESPTRHIFLMQDGEYRCSRCGAPMNDRALDEECPAAKSGSELRADS